MPDDPHSITPLLFKQLSHVRGLAGGRVKSTAPAWCARLQTVFADKREFEATTRQDGDLRAILLDLQKDALEVWRSNPQVAGADGRIFLAEPPQLRWEFDKSRPVDIYNRMPSRRWPFFPGSQVAYWGSAGALKHGCVVHYNPARKVDAVSSWVTVEGRKMLSIKSFERVELVWLGDVAMPNAAGVMQLARSKVEALHQRIADERKSHGQLVRDLLEAAEFYGQAAKTGKIP